MIVLEKYRPDWEYKRLQFGALILNSSVDKKIVENEIPVKLCNYVDVYKNDIITESLDFMDGSATQEEINKFSICAGDVIITKDSESPDDIGIPAFVEKNLNGVVCGYHLAILKPFENKLNGRFLSFFLNSRIAQTNFELGSNGVTRFGLSRNAIKTLQIPIPKYEEQTLIARYLDQKTGQIDRLIEQKEKLLKLLAEKRTAIITQAVTKGLDPDVEMIDSGIDWLGEIPKDWKVKKIKFLTNKVKTGTTPSSVGPDYYTDGTVDWYNPSDFNYESIELVESKRKIQESFFEDSKLTKYPKASVLIVGIGATLGKVGVSYSESYSNQQINAIYPTEKFSSEYLAYVLSSLVEVLKVYSNSTTLGIMNQEKTKNFSVPCPVVEVQDQIVFRIKELDKSLDTLIRKTIKSLVQLKEYRESLITAAVTGQIDVRKEITDE